MEDVANCHSKEVVSGSLFINIDHVRQALYRKKRMDYQKDKDVVKSIKLWFREIEDVTGLDWRKRQEGQELGLGCLDKE